MTVGDQFAAILERITGVERRMEDRLDALDSKLTRAMDADEKDRRETNKRLTALEFSRAFATGAIAAVGVIYSIATDLFGLLSQH